MSRNLKLLGLAVIAVLALGAIAASITSAVEEEPITRPYWFKSDGFASKTTTVTGVQGKGGHEFETETLTITCPTATYKGTLAGETTTTINLAPTYGGCTSGLLSVTVDMNGCTYTLHTDEQTGNVTSPIIIDWFNAFDTTTTIECPTTKIGGKEVTDEIQITALMGGTLKCTIDIPEQNLGTGFLLQEAGEGITKDIGAIIDFRKMTYTQTAGTGDGACTELKDKSNGKYRGSSTLTGDNPAGEATNIWVDPYS